MHAYPSIQVVISAIFQWAFILAVATSPIALNVWAWILLRRPPVPDIGAPWRRRVAYLALAGNFFAYALPIAALVRNFTLMSSGRPVNADELVDGRHMQSVMACAVAVSLLLAIMGPKYVRLPLILSPLLPFLFSMALPGGIL